MRAWNATRSVKPPLDVLLAALEQFKASPDWTKDAGRFIPHGSSWLNGRRWEEMEPDSPSQEVSPTVPEPYPAWREDLEARWPGCFVPNSWADLLRELPDSAVILRYGPPEAEWREALKLNHEAKPALLADLDYQSVRSWRALPGHLRTQVWALIGEAEAAPTETNRRKSYRIACRSNWKAGGAGTLPPLMMTSKSMLTANSTLSWWAMQVAALGPSIRFPKAGARCAYRQHRHSGWLTFWPRAAASTGK